MVIRTLDPPLHEFLPKREDLMVDIAVLPYADIKKKKEFAATYSKFGAEVKNLKTVLPELLKRVEELHEFNPMLGHRGCRLGVTYPEITEMQARAIFEAVVPVSYTHLWIAALLGEEIVPFEIAGVHAGALTSGHRRLGAREIAITTADYEQRLRDHYVILSAEQRREKIRKELAGVASRRSVRPAFATPWPSWLTKATSPSRTLPRGVSPPRKLSATTWVP